KTGQVTCLVNLCRQTASFVVPSTANGLLFRAFRPILLCGASQFAVENVRKARWLGIRYALILQYCSTSTVPRSTRSRFFSHSVPELSGRRHRSCMTKKI